ncbi:MAG: DUF4416 domain-containing protein [Deltaproteobacteria bacterium]|nr:MAG: DUF4416 domain-containing protein [Deltaproteobacteria bacterium]
MLNKRVHQPVQLSPGGTVSELKEPKPAKVITGLLISPSVNQQECFEMLFRHFGDIDFISESIQFDYSKYYEPEMGTGLKRRFVAYKDLRRQDDLVSLKLLAMEIEDRFKEQGKRRLNVDPGLVTLERLVLATGKNYTHRIYLRTGVFADLTLVFKKGTYIPLPWTYPDYKEPLIIEWFNKIRQKYNHQLKNYF